jgi:hypothetical protein
MTIRYSNGSQRSAILVARTEFAIRVAIVGSDDLVEYRAFAGTWMSEAFEPVEIDFYSTQPKRDPFPTVEACICPRELASQLIDSLLTGGGPSIKKDSYSRPNRQLTAHI